MTRAALVGLLLALASCTAFENPLVGGTDAPFDVRLVGRWEGDAPEKGTVRLVIGSDGRVDLTSIDPESGTEKNSFRLRTAQIDGYDVANVAIENDGKTSWQPLRYQLSGRDELRVFLCNDETWYAAVKRGDVAGNASRGPEGPSTLVTAPSGKLLDFAQAHRDSVFIAEPIVLRKKR